eukprot:CFRG0024T1
MKKRELRKVESNVNQNVNLDKSNICVDDDQVNDTAESTKNMPKMVVECDKDGIPLHLDEEGRRRLIVVRRWSKSLDTCVRVPFTKWTFGIDPVIGLIPVIGDLVGAGLGSMIIVLAAKWSLPKRALLRMTFNQGLDCVIGLVPFVGDMFDFLFKASRKNLLIIENYIIDEKAARSSDGSFFCILFTLLFTMWLLCAAIVALIIFGIVVLIRG